MSEIRVALIAEGPTDRVIIEAALKAILPRSFTIALIQPEPLRPKNGGGWCGVFKWCRAFAARSLPSLEMDPILPGFDLFVIHIDADVAENSYADGGAAVEAAAQGLASLPCSVPCPPAAGAVDALRRRVVSWLGMQQVGSRTVLCIPSKSVEAWLASGILNSSHPILNGVECNFNLEKQLAALPMSHRIRKNSREYQMRASAVTSNWLAISAVCTQARRFCLEVSAIVTPGVDPCY